MEYSRTQAKAGEPGALGFPILFPGKGVENTNKDTVLPTMGGLRRSLRSLFSSMGSGSGTRGRVTGSPGEACSWSGVS